MKIITWNINGLRSMKNGVKNILEDLDADIVCFQETKISRSTLPEDTALVDSYSSYFTFPRKQSGYSGVAVYARSSCTPFEASEGLTCFSTSDGKCDDEFHKRLEVVQESDLRVLDSEGRTLISCYEFKHNGETEVLAIINVYCPCVDPEKPERQVFKMQFCHALGARAQSLLNNGWHVVIVGDLNIAHHTIDHCDPCCEEEEFNATDARRWLTSLTESSDDSQIAPFVDAYRYFYPNQREAFTCWNTKTAARKTNYGTRIDYVLISHTLVPFLTSCEILKDVHGSDHCPVVASFDLEMVPSAKPPTLCTRFWPEFSGKQQELSNFLQKSKNSEPINSLSQDSMLVPMKKRKLSVRQKSIANFFKSSGKAVAHMSEQVQQHQATISDGEFIIDELSTQSPSQEIHEVLNCLETEKTKQTAVWKELLAGPPKPPVCKGHQKPCILKTVRKDGPNLRRQFYVCAQPKGHASNPDSQCNFFQWVTAVKRSTANSS